MTLTLLNNMPFFGFTNNMLLVESVDLLEREREREREDNKRLIITAMQYCIGTILIIFICL